MTVNAAPENDSSSGYPNVHARLQRRRQLPGTPRMTAVIDIWMRGNLFRIRDEAGRRATDLLADIQDPQGFGRLPRTIEDFMDTASDAERTSPGATEVFGDLSTGLATVLEAGQAPRSASALEFATVAEQVLVPSAGQVGRPAGQVHLLDRPAGLYESEVTGEADGFAYRSIFTWAIADPFVLRRRVSDAENPGRFAEVEVVLLEQSPVPDTDLLAP